VSEDGSPVRVVVDPKSLLYLSGTVLDWEQTLMKQGFKFVNPHEKAGCGCGHSFSV
jgi:iron-sulfur cluster assembly protein